LKIFATDSRIFCVITSPHPEPSTVNPNERECLGKYKKELVVVNAQHNKFDLFVEGKYRFAGCIHYVPQKEPKGLGAVLAGEKRVSKRHLPVLLGNDTLGLGSLFTTACRTI
jgi:hypothetical protein